MWCDCDAICISRATLSPLSALRLLNLQHHHHHLCQSRGNLHTVSDPSGGWETKVPSNMRRSVLLEEQFRGTVVKPKHPHLPRHADKAHFAKRMYLCLTHSSSMANAVMHRSSFLSTSFM